MCRQSKKDYKSVREKEYRTILKRYNILLKEKYKPDLVELETPIRDGYYLEFGIKPKFLENKIINKLTLLLDNQIVVWCRDKSFKKRIGKNQYEYLAPKFNIINEYEYEKLDDSIKEFYVLTKYYSWGVLKSGYVVETSTIKKYFYHKRSKAYITHRVLLDEEMLQEADYLEDRLNQEYHNLYWNSWGYNKFEAKMENRRFRRKEREFKFSCLRNGVDDIDLIEF